MTGPLIHFCSGLPRSGSTLLMNVLGQNPRFKTTATSGICEMIMSARNYWDKISEFRAMDEQESEAAKLRVLRGMLEAYHGNVEQPVVVDKCRGWHSELELLECLLDRKVKVLVPVRHLLDILSSFEKLYRKTKVTRRLPQEDASYYQMLTLEGRCQNLLGVNQILGSAISRIKDAVARGFRDRLYFVEFDRLCRAPRTVLKEIYEFLDEEEFEHDFNNVEQLTHENDRAHVWMGLHDIRPQIEPVESDWSKVLKPYLSPGILQAYKNENSFWQELKA